MIVEAEDTVAERAAAKAATQAVFAYLNTPSAESTEELLAAAQRGLGVLFVQDALRCGRPRR